ncbi:MAG TPA: TM2 domain-containing protein [Gemmatimonadales bacterium]|nr:TM2 domain-containing protein [Gemmatimonadales bacterium]
MNLPEEFHNQEPSERSRLVALVLAVLLGMFGGHRFYAGRVQSGVLMACTLGGLGLWWLYDVIVVGAGGFRDGEGRLITNWEPEGQRLPSPSADLLEEVDALRREVAELAERVDFAERLLADPAKSRRPGGDQDAR